MTMKLNHKDYLQGVIESLKRDLSNFKDALEKARIEEEDKRNKEVAEEIRFNYENYAEFLGHFPYWVSNLETLTKYMMHFKNMAKKQEEKLKYLMEKAPQMFNYYKEELAKIDKIYNDNFDLYMDCLKEAENSDEDDDDDDDDFCEET